MLTRLDVVKCGLLLSIGSGSSLLLDYQQSLWAAGKKCEQSFDGSSDPEKNDEVSAESTEEQEGALPNKVATFALSFFEKHNRAPEQDDFLLRFPEYDAEGFAWTWHDVKAAHPRRYEEARHKVRARIIRNYKKFASERGRSLSVVEFANLMKVDEGVTAQWFNADPESDAFFKDAADLIEQAEKEHPKAFQKIHNLYRFPPERNIELIAKVRDHSRIISTSVFAGVETEKDFWDALQNYSEHNDAMTIVNPVNYTTLNIDKDVMDKAHVLTHTLDLSPDLWIHNMKIMGKMKRPLMGTSRLGSRGKSVIFGSPQMSVEQIPVLHNPVYPHKMMTNGTVSKVRFAGAKYVEDRLDKLMEYEVVKGALIIEKAVAQSPLTGGLIGAGAFHTRHVEYIHERKGFWDLGVFYTKEEAIVERPAALILGDSHVGVEDQKLLASLESQILVMQPSEIVLHDLFNFDEISGWESDKPLSKALRAKNKNLDLEKAFVNVIHFINLLHEKCPKAMIYVVRSNHNDWLERWLLKGQYINDSTNFFIAHELVHAIGQGWDPLHYGLVARESPKHRVAFPKRLAFLQPGEHHSVGPDHRRVVLSVHGHVGANGAKGGKKAFKEAADRMVYGHTHTYYRDGGLVNIGTNSVVPAAYARDGASSNNQSLALVTQDGAIQVLEYRDGRWYTDPKLLPIAPEEFFPHDYPYVLPNSADIVNPGGEGQFSQYNPR